MADYIAMAYIVMTYVVMAYIVMAYIVMAYIVMAYIFMAYIVIAYIVMAYIVMAYIVMAWYLGGLAAEDGRLLRLETTPSADTGRVDFMKSASSGGSGSMFLVRSCQTVGCWLWHAF